MGGQKSTSKREKKRIQTSLGGCNSVGGVVLVGGVLAVASLVAGFAIRSRRRDGKRNSKRPCVRSEESKNEFSCRKEDEGREGLRFLFQISSLPSSHNSCFTAHGTSGTSVTQIDPCETIVFSKSLVLGEKPMTEIGDEKEDYSSGHQEIILSDDSKPESIASCDDCGVIEQSSSLVLENPTSIQEMIEKNDSEVERNDSEKDPVSVENFEEEESDEAAPIVRAEEVTVEEENDDEEEECVAKTGEKCSEGAGDSSMESNAEAIWPAELKESQELKQTNTNPQTSLVKPEEEEEETVKTEDHGFIENSKNGDAIENEAAEKPVMVKNQPTRALKLRTWIFCLLLLVLLMLLLPFTHDKTMSYYLLYRDSSIFRETLRKH